MTLTADLELKTEMWRLRRKCCRALTFPESSSETAYARSTHVSNAIVIISLYYGCHRSRATVDLVGAFVEHMGPPRTSCRSVAYPDRHGFIHIPDREYLLRLQTRRDVSAVVAPAHQGCRTWGTVCVLSFGRRTCKSRCKSVEASGPIELGQPSGLWPK